LLHVAIFFFSSADDFFFWLKKAKVPDIEIFPKITNQKKKQKPKKKKTAIERSNFHLPIRRLIRRRPCTGTDKWRHLAPWSGQCRRWCAEGWLQVERTNEKFLIFKCTFASVLHRFVWSRPCVACHCVYRLTLSVAKKFLSFNSFVLEMSNDCVLSASNNRLLLVWPDLWLLCQWPNGMDPRRNESLTLTALGADRMSHRSAWGFFL